jgi:hypothetical protein
MAKIAEEKAEAPDKPEGVEAERNETSSESGRRPIYTQVSALNLSEHGDLRLSPANSHAFAKGMNAIPLAAAEFPQAAAHYPIVFSQTGETWSAYAVSGPKTGHNAFVGQDGKWMEGAYIPAIVRRYPFILLEDKANATFSLAADLDSDMLNTTSGQLLYEDGKPSKTAENILRFCVSLDNQLKLSSELYGRIADTGILVARNAEVTLPGNEKSRITGFHIVDEAALSKLDDAKFLGLRAGGVLNLIYAHLWSMRSWNNILA